MSKLTTSTLLMLYVIFFAGSMTYADPTIQDTVVRYYSISPTAFATGGFSYSTEFIQDEGPVAAPINLPDSARVIEFKIWIYDVSTKFDCPASLYRTLLNFGSKETMAHVTSNGAVGNQIAIDTTIEYSIIDNATYKYHVEMSAFSGDSFPGQIWFYSMRIKYIETTTIIGTRDAQTNIHSPQTTIMSYPTPFSANTTIKYNVHQRGLVTIEIYDETGRFVRTLVDDVMMPGSYTARWDGSDSQSRKVAAGSYFCIVKTNGESTTKVVHVQ